MFIVTGEATVQNEGAAQGDAVKRERSTIAFAYGDLDSAVKVAKGIHQVGGSKCQFDQLAAKLGIAEKGGGFRSTILTAKTFGLVTYAQGTILLTPLGTRMADHQQEAAAKADAFLSVPLYRAIHDKFKGATLPPTNALENEMVTLGVAEKVKGKARQSFHRSAKQAGFFAYGQDRLVMPATGGTQDRPPDDEPNPDPDVKKNGDDGNGGRHDLIEGLIKALPKDGDEWLTADRRRWLQLAEGIFDFVYTKPVGDVDRVEGIGVENSAK